MPDSAGRAPSMKARDSSPEPQAPTTAPISKTPAIAAEDRANIPLRRCSDGRGSAGSDEGGRASLGELVGDDQPLDLAGALPDPLDPDLSPQPLGDVLPHVATAAEDLDGSVGDPTGELGRGELDHRRPGVEHLDVDALVDR